MLSLICNQSIDLTDKKVLMFSYGSGCAASMFILRFNAGYKNIQRIAYYKDRLASRVKICPEDFDREMSMREEKFGLGNFKPVVSKLFSITNTTQLCRVLLIISRKDHFI